MAIPDEESTLIYKTAKSGYSKGLTDTNRPAKAGEGISQRTFAGLSSPAFFVGNDSSTDNDPYRQLNQRSTTRAGRSESP
jgi:hypothetical protein